MLYILFNEAAIVALRCNMKAAIVALLELDSFQEVLYYFTLAWSILRGWNCLAAHMPYFNGELNLLV